MHTRETRSHTSTCALLHVLAIKSPSSGRYKYKGVLNTSTLITLVHYSNVKIIKMYNTARTIKILKDRINIVFIIVSVLLYLMVAALYILHT